MKVLISGGWDLMHYNHIKTLQMVKQLGSYLVVNVLSDERMRAKKGKDRPFIPLRERMAILTELKCVDEVISIPGVEYPLFHAIEQVKPDIVCINIDEQPDIAKEKAYCAASNITLYSIHRIDDGVSTTKLIELLRGGK